MSLWSSILYKIKEIFKSMLGSRTLEQTLHVTPIISSKMEESIQLWSNMYKDESPWLHEPDNTNPARITSLGLAAMIANEKARMALLEFESKITPHMQEVNVNVTEYAENIPTNGISPALQDLQIRKQEPIGPTERADFLNEQYDKLKRKLRTQIEYGIAKGGLVIKPYPVQIMNADGETHTELEFDYIQADNYYPLAFDANGRITQAAFLQTKLEGKATYRRLEYHKWENGTVTIINKAFKSTDDNIQNDTSGVDLGTEVSLTEIPEWEEIQPKVTINNVSQPLFAYFKMPEANNVDPTSPLGVSGFSKAVNLIKDADMQYSRLLWEYEAGEMAIDIDRDALRTEVGKDGQTYEKMNMMQQRLYRKVDLGTEATYQPYAPALRDNQYVRGLNTILMRIEDNTGLSRGTLSDVTNEAKTATELKMLRQRSYQTNANIQEAIEDALRDVVYVMNVYATLYNITPDGEYEISFEWDDSILTDKDDELGKRITLQQNGLASKLENRMWYFGETEEQAQAALLVIEQENMRMMEHDIMRELEMGASSNESKSPVNEEDKEL